MEKCFICEQLKEKGEYSYSKVMYTSIHIKIGKNKKLRIFAYGEGEASIPCNYCPNCGSKIVIKENKDE